MNKVYNSRQLKIYEDYVDYSTDRLIEMVNSEKYMNEVINVLEDILITRNAIPDNYKREKLIPLISESELKVSEEDRIKEINTSQEEVGFFIKQLEHSSDKDLAEIITKYTSYQPNSVEAALITAEKRGTISSLEKKKLLSQIEKGFYEYNKKGQAIIQEKSRKSSRQIQTGLILVTLGVVLTAWTWKNPLGGYNIVFFGLIFSGAALLYKGFFIDN
jgi:hypothetical protein